MGEIDGLLESPVMTGAYVVDRMGRRTMFVLGPTDPKIIIARDQIIVGHTVFIRYAELKVIESKNEPRRSYCIFVPNPTLVRIIPASIKQLLELDLERLSKGYPGVGNSMARCAVCDRSPPQYVCSSCQLAHYCSKECQRTHWSASHKKQCMIWEGIREIHDLPPMHSLGDKGGPLFDIHNHSFCQGI